jgi:hypothetical protein
MSLNEKIMRTALPKEHFMEAGRRLGILKDGILVFKDEEEPNVLMDFALHDLKPEGRSVVEAYRESNESTSSVEKEILDNMASSYTSLFKIESLSASEHILVLSDLLNDRRGIELIDIAFSQTAVPGLVLFIRLVAYNILNMTSGFSFIFPAEIQRNLLRRYRKHLDEARLADDPEERFVFFFKENELYGEDVYYE